MEVASQVLTWALDLGPASKDRLRYLNDLGFVMLSFCAFFILQAFQAFGSAVPQSSDYLDTVAEAAQLMIELAMDSKHAPAVYGRSILTRLARVREANLGQAQAGSNTAFTSHSLLNSRPRNGSILDSLSLVGHDPSRSSQTRRWISHRYFQTCFELSLAGPIENHRRTITDN